MFSLCVCRYRCYCRYRHCVSRYRLCLSLSSLLSLLSAFVAIVANIGLTFVAVVHLLELTNQKSKNIKPSQKVKKAKKQKNKKNKKTKKQKHLNKQKKTHLPKKKLPVPSLTGSFILRRDSEKYSGSLHIPPGNSYPRSFVKILGLALVPRCYFDQHKGQSKGTQKSIIERYDFILKIIYSNSYVIERILCQCWIGGWWIYVFVRYVCRENNYLY